MFPEYRDLISEFKTTDRHFLSLFEKHNELDQKIKNIESRIEPGTHEEIRNSEERKTGSQRPALQPLEKVQCVLTELYGCLARPTSLFLF